jgi:hypothetical protein
MADPISSGTDDDIILDPDQQSLTNMLGQPPAPVQSPTQQWSSSVGFSSSAPTAVRNAPVNRTQIDPVKQKLEARGNEAAAQSREALVQANLARNKAAQEAEAAQRDANAAQERAQTMYEGVGDDVRALEEKRAATQQYLLDNRDRTQNALQEMDNMSKLIATEQPHDLWAEAGFGTKAMAIALSSLGAAVQSFYGDKQNVVIDQIDAGLKREMTMQRLRMEKRKDDYANKNLLLSRMAQHFEHIEEAEKAAYVAAWKGIQARLEVAKSLTKSSEFASKIDVLKSNADMKIADAYDGIATSLFGNAVRATQADLVAEKDLGVANTRQSIMNQRQEIREKEEARRESVRQIPEYEGEFLGTDKSADEFRGLDTTARQATAIMQKLIADYKAGGQLTSYAKWNDIRDLESRAVAVLKGRGLINAGANFTKLESDLIAKGFLGGNGKWLKSLDPGTANRIHKAIEDLWNDVEVAAKGHGLKPKGHKYLTAE